MENENLTKSVDVLAENIVRVNSLKSAFFRGIFFGLGSAIGASIIAAIVIGTLTKLFYMFNLPRIGK